MSQIVQEEEAAPADLSIAAGLKTLYGPEKRTQYNNAYYLKIIGCMEAQLKEGKLEIDLFLMFLQELMKFMGLFGATIAFAFSGKLVSDSEEHG